MTHLLSVPLTADKMLPMLLTTESLLFAAFGIGVSLAAPTEFGRSRFFTKGYLAVGAGAAWVEVFGHPWPEGLLAWLQAGALAAGIVFQPLLTLLIAFFLRR
jgi:hypothetical protein